jgi:hypothetical protein
LNDILAGQDYDFDDSGGWRNMPMCSGCSSRNASVEFRRQIVWTQDLGAATRRTSDSSSMARIKPIGGAVSPMSN